VRQLTNPLSENSEGQNIGSVMQAEQGSSGVDELEVDISNFGVEHIQNLAFAKFHLKESHERK